MADQVDHARIIYIMGTGRSGSTVLEILLANASNALGLGEVTHVWRDGFVEDKACSCGRRTSECPVWADAARHFTGTEGMLAEAERVRNRLEKHSAIWNHLLGLTPKAVWAKFREYSDQLLENIPSGQAVLIDSSKYASRAYALKRTYGDAVKIIWLTRSPLGLLASFQKPNSHEQPPKRPLATLLYYMYVTLCARVVAVVHRRTVMKVKYEDLVDHPGTELRRIEMRTGLNLQTVITAVLSEAPFDAGHLVTGNRLRLDGRLRLGNQGRPSRPKGIEGRASLILMNTWRLLVQA